jgi:hypothetical protein
MIGRAILITATLVGLPGSVASQTRAADSTAIVRLVHQHVESMRALRAIPQGAIYAPDAVWINAFGRRIVGRDSIVAFLGALYAEPGHAGSRIVRETPRSYSSCGLMLRRCTSSMSGRVSGWRMGVSSPVGRTPHSSCRKKRGAG